MVRKILGWTLIFLGGLCFLLCGGSGSMRFISGRLNLHSSIFEDVLAIGFIILLPILSFFLLKYGFKLIK